MPCLAVVHMDFVKTVAPFGRIQPLMILEKTDKSLVVLKFQFIGNFLDIQAGVGQKLRCV